MRILLICLGVLATTGCASRETTPSCPARFEAFLERFLADADFQKAYTASEVVFTEANGGEPITRRMTRAAVKFPVILNRAQLKAEGVQTHLDVQDSEASFRFHLPDSDALAMSYDFRRTDCWRLVAFEDGSL